jgi:hypothetical protein
MYGSWLLPSSQEMYVQHKYGTSNSIKVHLILEKMCHRHDVGVQSVVSRMTSSTSIPTLIVGSLNPDVRDMMPIKRVMARRARMATLGSALKDYFVNWLLSLSCAVLSGIVESREFS